MKIKITYDPNDRKEAAAANEIFRLVSPFFKGGKMSESRRHDPHRHIYLSTGKVSADK